jgi:hypothetical protein
MQKSVVQKHCSVLQQSLLLYKFTYIQNAFVSNLLRAAEEDTQRKPFLSASKKNQPVYTYFTTRLPWRWKQLVSPKRWSLPVSAHLVAAQRGSTDILTALRISFLTQNFMSLFTHLHRYLKSLGSCAKRIFPSVVGEENRSAQLLLVFGRLWRKRANRDYGVEGRPLEESRWVLFVDAQGDFEQQGQLHFCRSPKVSFSRVYVCVRACVSLLCCYGSIVYIPEEESGMVWETPHDVWSDLGVRRVFRTQFVLNLRRCMKSIMSQFEVTVPSIVNYFCVSSCN